MRTKPKICFFVSFSGDGGVERMIVNLCEGFLALGYTVDLVLVRDRSKHLAALPEGIRVVKLDCSHTATSLLPFMRYLRSEKPDAVLSAKNRGNQIALVARAFSGVRTRLVARMDTTVSAALEKKGGGGLRKLLWYPPMRFFYGRADAIVAVSKGVAEDLSRITGLPVERITVVPNPVITPKIFTMAQEPVDHPWFRDSTIPVLIGIGRLTQQKDFHTLLRAFAQVRRERPCRLLILGEGGDRPSLEKLARELGVSEDLDLHGFVSNPYAFLKRSTLFVLSSAWEGSPTVLTEALALGIPSVSTDCPSGPREILDGGRLGPLVPVGDVNALARGILTALDAPPESSALQAAAADYTIEESSRRHLRLLLGRDPMTYEKESAC